MGGAESIILVPGLFGFARIGDIDYFAAVTKLLANATKVDDIETLATPPTAPLWRRVDVLHQCVIGKIRQGAAKIHLVGHSTGGVDVRLLTNSRYLWPSGPSGDDRSSFFDRIGSVVSLSAPQKGTPIARRLRGTLENVVPLFFLVSILAKYRAERPRGAVKELWKRIATLEHHTRLARAIKVGSAARWSLREVARAPEPLTHDLRDYLGQIIDDHPLIHELTPHAMQRLNAKLAPATTGDGRQLSLSSFVTVSPPPALHRTDFRLRNGLAPAQRAFYAASYEATSPDADEAGPLPDGRLIGMPDGLEEFAKGAQDGVVPAASQTLDGHADVVVFADHLDVVGHYPGARHGGETVFDSGADFDDGRMEDLWNAVGAVIIRSPALSRRAA
jgi:hypothetical protein